MEFLNDVLPLLLVLLVWVLWWLLAVNWRKAWPMLADGGWAPLVLLMVMTSMAWAMIDARPCNCLGFMVVPNGWWQLGYVSTLVALALVCGWLQGYFALTPADIPIEPPPEEHAHHDGHAHH